MTTRRGQSLVIVLWVIGLVSIAVGAAVMRSTHELRLGRIPLAALRARAISQAAVARAADLVTLDDPAVDHLTEPWATGIDAQSQAQLLAEVPLGTGMFSVGVIEQGEFMPGLIDEERKLNLNTADVGALTRLIELVGAGAADPAQVASAIADWRDEPLGVFCATAAPACHNAPFATVDEARLVPGMTPELFDALQPYVTVYGSGVVNANTAPALVLSALGHPGEQIVQQRAAQPYNAAYLPPDGLGYTSSAFAAEVEAREPGFPRHLRLRAVFNRAGRTLGWRPAP